MAEFKIAMLVIDKNHTIESISDACLAALQKERQQVIGKKCYLAVHGVECPPAFCPLRDGKSIPDAAEYAESCQEFLKLHPVIRCTPLFDEEGKVLKVLGLEQAGGQEFSPRDLYPATDYRLDEILDTIQHILILTDTIGVITKVNRVAMTTLGLTTEDQLLDRSIYEFISPAGRQRFQQEWQKILTQGKLEQAEQIFQRADGTEFPGRFNSGVIRDSFGETIGVILDIRNVATWRQLQESLKFSGLILKSIKEFVFAWDKDNVIVHWNRVCEQVFGIPEAEAVGKKLHEVVDTVEHYEEQKLESNQRENPVHFRGKVRARVRGKTIWVDVDIFAIEQGGEREGFVCVARDVTEHEQMAQHISITDRAIASSITGIAIADFSGKVTYVNNACLKLWEYDNQQDVIGKPLTDFFHLGSDAPEVTKALQSNGYWSGELTGRKKDGSLFALQLSTSLVRDVHNKPLSIMASFMDITELKKSQESLRESEAFISSLLMNSHHPILVINPDTSIRYANPALEKLTGYALSELVGRKAPYPWMVQESMPRTAREFRIAMSRGAKWYEELYRKKNGKHFWVEVTSAPVMRDGKLYYYMVSWVDITDRRLIEEELTKERDRQKTYLDTVGVMVATVDAHGKITMVNRKACETLGYSEKELVGENWHNNLVPPRNRGDVRRMFRTLASSYSTNGARHSEGVLITKSGEEKLFTFTHTLLRVPGKKTPQILISGEDTTELRKTQEQLEHSHLLASLGEMTAGIAHEVNNPLGSILLYSELLMASDVPAQVKKDLKVIHEEAKRATKIMTDLLIYGRRTKPQIRRINLNSIVRRVLDMRRYQHKVQNISVSTDLADVPLYVRGDSSQLMQVIMNIVLNAEDAILEHKGGNITIKTSAGNRWAKVQVIDDGPGIPDEHINQIFYPFFTTKPVGEGTGLGLSICYGIVTAHGGLIRAENNAAGGATFTVELPIASGKNGKNGNGTSNGSKDSVLISPSSNQ